MHLEFELRKRHLALFVGSIAVLVAIAATPQLLGDRVADGFDGLAAAEAGWLWLAGSPSAPRSSRRHPAGLRR